jgi:hypothetical protein
MTYLDFKNLIAELNTGSTLPTSIDNICKLVLGKIARRKLRSTVRLAIITTSGSLSLDLNTLLPDFIDFKTDVENHNRCIYFYEGTVPFYFNLTNNTRFADELGGYSTTLIGKTLKIKMPAGEAAPATIYFTYYSKYLVETSAGVRKETPSNDDDELSLPSIFDDLLVDGVLFYISRKEKEDSEFSKNANEWERD